MPRLSARRVSATWRRGFTIVELLIAMTILGVVGTLVARVMMGQQRFYQRTNEQMSMRRELRTAMSLLPSDLRSISSSGGDLTNFSETEITFRNVLGTSVMCARPSVTTIDIPPVNMARNILTSWYTPPEAGDTVWAFNDSLSRGAEDDVWTPLPITAVGESVGLCPLSPFTDAVLDLGKKRYRISVGANLPDSVKVGSALRFTRSTRYQLEAQASGRYYLTRSEYVGGGWGAATPVSGPYAAPSASGSTGIRFSYFDSSGFAVTNPTRGRDVSRIDLLLRAKGANSTGSTYVGQSKENTDSLAFRIALRNRQ